MLLYIIDVFYGVDFKKDQQQGFILEVEMGRVLLLICYSWMLKQMYKVNFYQGCQQSANVDQLASIFYQRAYSLTVCLKYKYFLAEYCTTDLWRMWKI